ncbi:hypothetical protein [Streptomyces milbemycinicus]|uniref:Uncharacterized protein n=1 Tax=Streptomyces milbemycinicus TaxID=476552 RepID=A0ABW8LQ28_9ACTN
MAETRDDAVKLFQPVVAARLAARAEGYLRWISRTTRQDAAD